MLRKGSKARAQRPEQCIGRQLFMGWGSLHSPHLSDVKRVEPWDGRPIVAEMSTKRHKRFRDECSLLGSSGNCCFHVKTPNHRRKKAKRRDAARSSVTANSTTQPRASAQA